jgi:hypothetical protein
MALVKPAVGQMAALAMRNGNSFFEPLLQRSLLCSWVPRFGASQGQKIQNEPLPN